VTVVSLPAGGRPQAARQAGLEGVEKSLPGTRRTGTAERNAGTLPRPVPLVASPVGLATAPGSAWPWSWSPSPSAGSVPAPRPPPRPPAGRCRPRGPAPLLQPADHHHPAALRQRHRGMLGLVTPDHHREERRLTITAARHRHPQRRPRDPAFAVADLRGLGEVAGEAHARLAHAAPSFCCLAGRGEHSGADGADGAFLLGGSASLPARHGRPRRRHRDRLGRAGRGRIDPRGDPAVSTEWHAGGTRPPEGPAGDWQVNGGHGP
jgi:hypothetical protein